MTHSAILPSQNHAHVIMTVLPGNLQLAIAAVMIHDVSFDDASKITSAIARHGLPPLVWEPPITAPATTPATVKPEVFEDDPRDQGEAPPESEQPT